MTTLTDRDRLAITNRIIAGEPSHKIAETYGMDPAIIHDVRCGKTWAQALREPPAPKANYAVVNQPAVPHRQAIVDKIQAGASMKEIAHDIGVSAGSLYHTVMAVMKYKNVLLSPAERELIKNFRQNKTTNPT